MALRKFKASELTGGVIEDILHEMRFFQSFNEAPAQ